MYKYVNRFALSGKLYSVEAGQNKDIFNSCVLYYVRAPKNWKTSYFMFSNMYVEFKRGFYIYIQGIQLKFQ